MDRPTIDWNWIDRHSDDIQHLSIEHLKLVLISVGISIAIWVPLAVLLRNRRVLFPASTTIAALIYTIPSLALFAFLVPGTGIGRTTVLIGLVLYSPLILMRNTVAGLRAVPGPVREAARGMGLTRLQTLLRVELPLALPSIFAGVRIITVTTVGIATIGVLVGFEGLGTLIYTDGMNRDFLTPIVVGAVIATAMAIVLDFLVLLAQRAVTPWARARDAAD
ncbi:MAG: ABC transporter permease [Thermoleophilia bacterium]